jgi:hypothetical protein
MTAESLGVRKDGGLAFGIVGQANTESVMYFKITWLPGQDSNLRPAG